MDKKINLGIFGMGTVGCGVVDLLRENRTLLEKRLGCGIRVKTAVVRNLSVKRQTDLGDIRLTDDPGEIFNDGKIDMILELAGGNAFPMRVLEHCLENRIPLVTANKAMLAEKSATLAEMYSGKRNYLGYDASVAGAIPILKTLGYGLCANEIREIKGIINGTANYILSSMEQEGREFSEALAEAQKLGFAEADPTFDIEGHDTAHKLCILIGKAFGFRFPFDRVYLEGISNLSKKDIEYALKLGYRIKLLGIAKITEAGTEGRVHPTLLPIGSPLASVMGASNGIFVQGNFCGPYLSTGLGAGSHPTASAVVSDILCHYENPSAVTPKYFFEQPPAKVVPMHEIRTQYYIRLAVRNHCGVLASISKILAEKEISISKVIQESHQGKGMADLVIITHDCLEAGVEEARRIILSMDYCTEDIHVIRMENDTP